VSGERANDATSSATLPVTPTEEDGLFDGPEDTLGNKMQAIPQVRIAPATRGNYFSMIDQLFCYLQDNNKLYHTVLTPALLVSL
jgi:hypothetical protein